MISKPLRALVPLLLLTAVATPASAQRVPDDRHALDAPAPSYLSIMFGRSIWTAACTPRQACAPFFQDAADLKSIGITTVVTGVVVNRMGATSRPCIRGVIYPTWNDLATLRTNYGWTAVSQGMNYVEMTTLTTDEQRYDESGATIPVLEAKGRPKPGGCSTTPMTCKTRPLRAWCQSTSASVGSTPKPR